MYVGPVAGGVEHLVVNLVPRLAACAGVECWFFIRYADEGGPHVRVRLKAAGDPRALRAATEPLIHRALSELPTVPPPAYRPALPVPPFATPAARGFIRAVPTAYEPEVEKFGADTLPVAEELFERSSALAIDVLRAEREGACSRKTLAPCLMQCVADAFAPRAGPRLWDAYTAHWLGVCRASHAEWRPRFVAKARALRESGVPVVPADDDLAEPARSYVSAWRRDLAAAARGYARPRAEPSPPAQALAFNFAHLMNNRLGIQPLEEAYYAALMHEEAVAVLR